LKVLEQHAEAHSATWVLEAKGGAEYALPLRLNGVRGVRAEGAMVVDKAPAAGQTPLAGDALLASEGAGMGAADAGLETLVVRFPVGAGYTRRSVTVRW
jgi:hypothetical protein